MSPDFSVRRIVGRWALAAALAMVAASSSLPASGQAASPPSAAPSAQKDAPSPPGAPSLADVLSGEAKAAYDAGHVLFVDGDFAGASLKMQRAYELSKEPRLLWNIAACEKKLRHYARVAPLVDRYLTEAAGVLSAEQIADARDVQMAMSAFVSRLTVNVDQPDASVSIDEAVVATTPSRAPILVDMGKRVIRVIKDGFRPWSETRDVVGASELVMDIHLTPQVRGGRLVVLAGAKDQIDVDGAPRAIGHLTEALPSGVHSVRVSGSGMRPHAEDVMVQDDATRTLRVTLVPESSGSKTWLWVAIGGGVALAAAGVVTAVVLGSGSDTTAPPRAGTMQPGVIELAWPGGSRR